MRAPESYVRWLHSEIIPTPVYCEGVVDDSSGFRVLLATDESPIRRLRVSAPGIVAYRNTNESFRLRGMLRMRREDGPIYRVIDSHFIEWLVDESEGVLCAEELAHYVIATVEDIIDVVVRDAIEVEWSSPTSSEATVR